MSDAEWGDLGRYFSPGEIEFLCETKESLFYVEKASSRKYTLVFVSDCFLNRKFTLTCLLSSFDPKGPFTSSGRL